MSLFVLSPDTIWNPGLLSFPTAPRKILERGTLLPRRDVTWRFLARVIFENQALRFLLPLLPLCIAALIWPSLALPFSAAPTVMALLIIIVEMRVLRMSKRARSLVGSDAQAARALDTLAFRARGILGVIAARKSIETGVIYLVIEQSDLARVPPMTVVSVQLDHGRNRLLPLDAEDRALIRKDLFDPDFSERDLLQANLREGVYMRAISFETRSVSAHARLAAFLDTTPPPQKAPV